MERLSELTIMDVKELVGGRKVQIFSTDDSAISVHMNDAVVIADPDAGTDGKITLLEPDTGCKMELDSDKLIESIHGNENAIVIRFSNGMGGLDIEIVKDILIHSIDKEFGCEEPAYKDFVSREEFINRTGIFVTPEHFEYIYDMKFKEANVSADEFISNYEEEYSDCIVEVPLDGTFKYEVMDEELSCIGMYEDTYDPGIWEIVNSLAMSYTTERKSKWDLVEKYKAALEDKLKILNEIQSGYVKDSNIQS